MNNKNTLCDRLRGKYAIGPIMENGEPEFGYRQFNGLDGKGIPRIQLEAAERIEELEKELQNLKEECKKCNQK